MKLSNRIQAKTELQQYNRVSQFVPKGFDKSDCGGHHLRRFRSLRLRTHGH
jgi:hypothetical protein